MARKSSATMKSAGIPSGSSVLSQALQAAGRRPSDTAKPAEKNQYAVKFAERMAHLIADDLHPRLKGIQATTKRSAGSVTGTKQLDINFSTPELGLQLGISLKSVHIRESSGGQRYTHNMKRNEEELRIEAAGYHKRQPYAVMIGVLFLPFDSCTDGKKKNSSSFGSWVRHLRPYTGRSTAHDELDRLERIYVALYETDGSNLTFFDVETDPPKNARPTSVGDLLAQDGRPRRLMKYDEFLTQAYHAYLKRNNADFRWADGSEDPLSITEIEPGPT